MTRDETLYLRQRAGEPNSHVRARDEHNRLAAIWKSQRAAMARAERMVL